MLKPDTLALTATLALLTALGPLSTDMYLPSLPAIGRDLQASVAEVQLTLSIFLFGFAAGQLGYGPVSDKVGRKPVLLFGIGLFVAASLACMLAPTIEVLVGARFVQALGASAPIVLARAMVRDLYDGPRAGRELSRMGTIMGVVPALAPVLGGVLQEVAGWRSTFAVTVLFGLSLALVASLRLPETIRQRTPGPLSFGAMLASFRILAGDPRFLVYAGLSTLAYGGLFAFISGSSFVLQNRYGLSELPYAFSFAFVVIGFIAGTLLGQRLVARRGLDGTLALGTVFLAAGGALMLALVLAGVPSSFAVTGPMALYTVGVGLTMPNSLASALAPFPERAGAASSLFGILQMTGAALIGIGIGQVLEGATLPLPIVIAATGLAALLLFRLTARARTGG
jgi:MFS transporter, DHA1 family, multidrug resistance protein